MTIPLIQLLVKYFNFIAKELLQLRKLEFSLLVGGLAGLVYIELLLHMLALFNLQCHISKGSFDLLGPSVTEHHASA